MVKEIAISPGAKRAASVSEDGSARVWNLETGGSVALLFGSEEWVAYTDDGYFDASRRGEALVAAARNGRAFSLEQLAVRNNRPDKLLERLGEAGSSSYHHFEGRFRDRLRRFGLVEEKLPAQFEAAPTAAILEAKQHGRFVELELEVRASEGDTLAVYEIFDNGVPLFDAARRSMTGTVARVRERVELVTGANHIEVGARSASGLFALRDTVDFTWEGPRTGAIHYVGFGVSRPGEYADHDVEAMGELFRSLATPRSVREALVRDAVTATRIEEALSLLVERTTTDDTVVIHMAGHGKRINQETRFLTHDSKADDVNTWLPLSLIIQHLDRVPARNRLLLVDTCESGEDVGPPPAVVEQAPFAGLTRDVQLHDRYIYTDITRRTGAVVFSAARGYESSKGDHSLQHGYFSYEIMTALRGKADTNGDRLVSVEELRRFVTAAVRARNKDQHPTIDRENRFADFSIPVISDH